MDERERIPLEIRELVDRLDVFELLDLLEYVAQRWERKAPPERPALRLVESKGR